MAVQTLLFAGSVTTMDGQRFNVEYIAEPSETEPKFDVIARIFGEELVAEVKLVFQIENPLILISVILAAAKLYGYCVGTKTVVATVKHCRTAYRESKARQPDIEGRIARTIDVVNRLSEKTSEFKDEFIDILSDCAGDLVMRGLEDEGDETPPT